MHSAFYFNACIGSIYKTIMQFLCIVFRRHIFIFTALAIAQVAWKQNFKYIRKYDKINDKVSAAFFSNILLTNYQIIINDYDIQNCTVLKYII